MIYLDHAATTPISDTALEIYTKVAQQYFGNPSSMHDIGSSAKQVLEASSKTIANTLNARARDIFFSSGASESNFLAIYSLLSGRKEKSGHLITSSIEHSSVRNIFRKLESEGYEVTRLPVDNYGKIDIEDLKNTVRENTLLASIQHVNSEIGTIQDIQKIGALLKERNILFHSDCVQSYGRLPLDIQTLNIDALSVSGHKIYGPKGVGAVWINPKSNWKPVFPDAENPGNFKPGTPDVPSIAAFAAAAKDIVNAQQEEQQRLQHFRTDFINELKKNGFDFTVIEHPKEKVPNILGLCFHGIEGQFLMLECNQAGLAISTGSACQVGSEMPNRTLTAIGKNEQEAREFIRLSFGKQNKSSQISQIIHKISSILSQHFNKVNHYRNKG